MKWKPTHNRLIIEPIEENTTNSGIVLTDTNSQTKKAKVIESDHDDINAGDIIYYDNFRAIEAGEITIIEGDAVLAKDA